MKNEIRPSCKYCHFPHTVRNGILRGKQIYKCVRCQRRFHEGMAGDIAFKPPEHVPEPINWANYNDAQTREKLLFLDILDDLNIAMQNQYLIKVPHFNTVLRYMKKPTLVSLLIDLITLSSLPLKDLETSFAVDATGLSSAFYSRWLDERLNQEHDWIKVHVMCGIKSGIVTSIRITDGHSHDSPQFAGLVWDTSKNFRIKEVMADKAYSSKDNLQTVLSFGAFPYIPFKSNTTGKPRGSFLWSKMFHYFQMHQEDFMKRYHLRSNVESVFSSLKRKFNSKLMLKNEVGQTNEALSTVLCHNICVLVSEAIEADFLKIQMEIRLHK